MDDAEKSFDKHSLKTCGFCKTAKRHATFEDLYNHVNECRLLYEKFEEGINSLIEKSDPDKMYIMIIPGYVSIISGDDAKRSLEEIKSPSNWSILKKTAPGSSVCLIPIKEDMVVII